MRFDIEKAKDVFILESGRRIQANCGVLGLRDDRTNGLILTEGYDGTVGEDLLPPDMPWLDPLTDAERAEIAAFMIERWKQWSKPR